MKDYFEFAKQNDILLLNIGRCQFCGSNTKRGIHECIEIFNFEIQGIDFSSFENHVYKFLMVDAHALQHPEIHGRWSNHFHLSRLHLIYKYNVKWNYKLSPKLSDVLNRHKASNQNQYLKPPNVQERGSIKTTDILQNQNSERECKEVIEKWAKEVYYAWEESHDLIDPIAKEF